MISVGKDTYISALSEIEDSVRGTSIIIGNNVVIDAFVKIRPVGGMGDIVIGDSTHLNSGTVLFSGNGVSIGERVLIAPNCSIVPASHAYDDPNQPIQSQGFSPSKGGIIIHDDVWIGANSVILDGSEIGQGCIVSAGSVVSGKLRSFGVYAGNPVRLLRIRKF
jgi:virginiamycin A acetyltransferase